MQEQSIRALVAALDATQRLARVARAVDPATELAAVGLKAHQERGQAVLFENAGGWRSAAQLLADRAQWETALGAPPEGLLALLEKRLGAAVAPVMVEAARAPVAAQRRAGDDVALERLPIPCANADDAAAQMAAVAISIDPDDGGDCLGLTRHHVVGPRQLSVIGLSPVLERLRQRWHRDGKAMPLALAMGPDPALYLAASLGIWRDADMALAGSLAGAPIKLVRADAGAPPLPAEAELVISGEIAPGEAVAAGRLATVFGTAAAAGAVPLFTARTLMCRADPIFYAMHVGAPGDLAATLALAAEVLVAAHIRNIEGGLDFIDIRVPPQAGGQVVVVKLRGRMEGQTKTALMGALSGIANRFKLAVAVDEDVNAADLRDVFWSIASRTHAERDVSMIDGLRTHPHDYAVPADAGGARVGTRWFIDSTMPPLTQPKAREDFARAIPKNLAATDLAAFLPQP
ncbi:MAG TPA: UbiD family decarboxylase [Stellaceae bacterium]|nr:UbiD family decarboxylase [Stellaceae bacterium]